MAGTGGRTLHKIFLAHFSCPKKGVTQLAQVLHSSLCTYDTNLGDGTKLGKPITLHRIGAGPEAAANTLVGGKKVLEARFSPTHKGMKEPKHAVMFNHVQAIIQVCTIEQVF